MPYAPQGVKGLDDDDDDTWWYAKKTLGFKTLIHWEITAYFKIFLDHS
jgi:hypothetical protein